jgi:2-oxoglutarate ferredoxin oxidoreductase subunit gamma
MRTILEPHRHEIRIAGKGGQGIVKMGLILAEAAAMEDKRVIQLQSYGAEVRGGECRSDVIIARDMDYPGVLGLDILIAFTQEAYDKYLHLVKPSGAVIFDSDAVMPKLVEGIVQFSVPFTKIAREIGGKKLINTVALGYLVALTNIVSKDSVERAISKMFPGKTEINLKAFRRGYMEYAKDKNRSKAVQEMRNMC